VNISPYYVTAQKHLLFTVDKYLIIAWYKSYYFVEKFFSIGFTQNNLPHYPQT